MQTIFKYQLDPEVETIKMPRGAQLLAVQLQNKIPHLWALVDKSKPIVKRRMEIVGTGWELDKRARMYAGTFQIDRTVWHVFDLGESA